MAKTFWLWQSIVWCVRYNRIAHSFPLHDMPTFCLSQQTQDLEFCLGASPFFPPPSGRRGEEIHCNTRVMRCAWVDMNLGGFGCACGFARINCRDSLCWTAGALACFSWSWKWGCGHWHTQWGADRSTQCCDEFARGAVQNPFFSHVGQWERAVPLWLWRLLVGCDHGVLVVSWLQVRIRTSKAISVAGGACRIQSAPLSSPYPVPDAINLSALFFSQGRNTRKAFRFGDRNVYSRNICSQEVHMIWWAHLCLWTSRHFHVWPFIVLPLVTHVLILFMALLPFHWKEERFGETTLERHKGVTWNWVHRKFIGMGITGHQNGAIGRRRQLNASE